MVGRCVGFWTFNGIGPRRRCPSISRPGAEGSDLAHASSSAILGKSVLFSVRVVGSRVKTCAGYLTGLVMLMALASPAKLLAQRPEDTADIRCVAVALKMTEMPSTEQKSAGLMMAVFYLGRLDGRVPNLDIEKLIVEQVGKMSNADYSSEAIRCGKSLSEKGQKITQIGQKLSQLGRPLQQTPMPSN
jgi:hypothetical protein